MAKFLGVFLLFLAGPALAIPVQWHLVDVQFDDGGTAYGSFWFDVDSADYFDVDIVTTAGSEFSGESYSFLNPNEYIVSGDKFLAVVSEIVPDMTGVPGMSILFFDPMTNVGGTLAITGFAESFCIDSTCSDATSELRAITAGSISTVAPVPLPAAVWLFGSALVGLGWMRRKRIR